MRLPGDELSLDVVDGLERLAEQSLVRHRRRPARRRPVHDARDDPRVRAWSGCGERGEGDPLRDRHAEAFLAFATAPRPATRPARRDRRQAGSTGSRTSTTTSGPRSSTWSTSGDTERASDLVFAAVWRFWHMRGHITEGRAPRGPGAGDAAAGPTGRPRARLRALEAAGGLAYWSGDVEGASRHYGAAVEMARAARRRGRDRQRALQLLLRAPGHARDSDEWVERMREAQPLLDEAMEIWTRLGDEHGHGQGLWGLGEYHDYRGEAERGEASATRALGDLRASRRPFWVSWARFTRGLRDASCRASSAWRRSTSSPRCASSGRAATCPA